MGLLLRAMFWRKIFMRRICRVDNMGKFTVHGYNIPYKDNEKDFMQAIVFKNKVILIPEGSTIIPTKGRIPHIRCIGVIRKYCPKCKHWNYINNFIKNKHAADGYKDTCRDCDNKRRRERYAKTKAVT